MNKNIKNIMLAIFVGGVITIPPSFAAKVIRISQGMPCSDPFAEIRKSYCDESGKYDSGMANKKMAEKRQNQLVQYKSILKEEQEVLAKKRQYPKTSRSLKKAIDNFKVDITSLETILKRRDENSLNHLSKTIDLRVNTVTKMKRVKRQKMDNDFFNRVQDIKPQLKTARDNLLDSQDKLSHLLLKEKEGKKAKLEKKKKRAGFFRNIKEGFLFSLEQIRQRNLFFFRP